MIFKKPIGQRNMLFFYFAQDFHEVFGGKTGQ